MPTPGTKHVAVFDADQVAKRHFVLWTVPVFDSGPENFQI
jgi:hypothetical protein